MNQTALVDGNRSTEPQQQRSITVCSRLLAFGAVLMMPVAGRAATRTPVRVEIAPPNVCADVKALEPRVTERGVIVSSAADTAALVAVAAKDSAFEGTLTLTRGAGTTTRTVTAATCDDVLDALAFTLALALEDEMALAEAPAAREPVPSLVDRSAVDRASVPPSRKPRFDLELGAAGGIVRAVAPAVAGSAGGWLLVGMRRETWFSPSAALGLYFGLPEATTVGATKATSAVQAATLDLCPARLGSSSFGVRPCVRTMLGRSQVRSEGFSSARLDERMLVTLGVAARGEIRVVGPLFGHLELAAGIPTERAAYFVGDTSVFETPAVALTGGLGAAVHFP